jgi:hypothetical protein
VLGLSDLSALSGVDQFVGEAGIIPDQTVRVRAIV